MKNIFKRTSETGGKTIKRFSTSIALALVALLLFLASTETINTGCTGVVKQFGAPTGQTMNNGFHFKWPWQTVEEVDTQLLKLEQDASAVSRDLQAVETTIALNYQVSPAKAVEIVTLVGASYLESEIIIPALQESVKAVTAKYTAEELIAQRAKVSLEMADTLEAKTERYGVSVQGFNVINFNFSAEFNAAIEAKQVAAQELIRVETEQKQLAVKAQAQAEAAKAEAEAILTKAKAQAEANRLISESLTPDLIEAQKIEKWNGQLPTVEGGSGAIIDMRTSQ